ncbi:RluA family pseudouridine synthase [Lactobacillus equicursoris]|uniref:RluA family pseudouridine synthase n=1 Tax=Lactobacillus equicursoris TaxID=420645 RepID=UPI00242CA60F|nr:RluA family pseudouridine synthase [Lactobacillus equicursoris]MDD6387150.1 RluA family pseudouridine synthase [Lactobacillus equicursoris]
MNYHFSLIYPDREAASVSDLLRELLVPRKWRHFLRIEKKVLVNGQYLNFNELVKPGDTVTLDLNQVESLQGDYPASGSMPDIVYEDDNILVINKPKGQKTHPNQGENGTALNDCATYLGYSPYIVHRLDMLTGGLLLVAKNPAVVPILNRQLISKTLKRDYVAEVDLLSPLNVGAAGTISLKIGQDPDDQRKRMVREDGLRAVTHYQVLAVDEAKRRARVALSLETGRTHQIRVHLAASGWPIVGDPLYNPLAADSDEDLQLTAWRLSFTKPFSFDRVAVVLPDQG